MTIICAQRVGDKVWIGSDSRGTNGTFIHPSPLKKWHQIGGWWMGYAGSYRLTALLSKIGRACADEWLAVHMVENLRRLMREDGWTLDDSMKGAPAMYHASMILVSPQREVFEVGDGGSIMAVGTEFVALGSGYEYACGAAFAIDMMCKPSYPDVKFLAAIKAACQYDTSCGGEPFVLEV